MQINNNIKQLNATHNKVKQLNTTQKPHNKTQHKTNTNESHK